MDLFFLVSVDLLKKQEETHQKYEEYEAAAGPLLEVFKDEERMEELEAEKNFTMTYLKNEVEGVTDESLIALYDFGKFVYECGVYDKAAQYLKYYRYRPFLLGVIVFLFHSACRALAGTEDSRSDDALWGKFAANILSGNWEEADRDREILKGAIEKKVGVIQGTSGFNTLMSSRSLLLPGSRHTSPHAPSATLLVASLVLVRVR